MKHKVICWYCSNGDVDGDCTECGGRGFFIVYYLIPRNSTVYYRNYDNLDTLELQA